MKSLTEDGSWDKRYGYVVLTGVRETSSHTVFGEANKSQLLESAWIRLVRVDALVLLLILGGVFSLSLSVMFPP